MVTFDFTKTPITQIADYIIIQGSKSGASDIHFDPREDGLMIRMRVDGDLKDYTFIPKAYERNLATRLKLLANMNITETRLPQDGSIKGVFGGVYLDTRVSCLPTNEGEKIVIRILDYSRSLEGIDYLGFSSENLVKLKRMIAEPNGIILITGATGSGKSTTVYSILQVLNDEKTNIITVEDPVEMNIEGMNQVQVNSEIGLDFATVLRSILRQDPNVILIGEIRDSETAKIAVRASITGHLVLSTIHTNNSLSTIERLLDMDVERYLLSSALTGIISQKLTKKLCPHCKIKRETTAYEKKVFKFALDKDILEISDANHEGCEHCNKGYHGRIAIHEVLEIEDDIKMAMNDAKLPREELGKLVYESNSVITLLQDGLLKVLDESTTFEEIYKAIDIDTSDIKDTYYKELEDVNCKKEEVKEQQKPAQPSVAVKEVNTTPVSPVAKSVVQQPVQNQTQAQATAPTTNTSNQPVVNIVQPTTTAPQQQTQASVTPVAKPVVQQPVQNQSQVQATVPTTPVGQTPIKPVVPVAPVNPNQTVVVPTPTPIPNNNAQ